jgi:molecular chaperone GrpE
MEDERNDASGEASATAQPPEQPESSADAAELKRQRDDYYDRLLRKTAEFDNYRKRTDRERIQLADAAAADLLTDLLPLVDDLERALKADIPADAAGKAGAGQSIRKGVELIHRQLLDILRKRGVKPIEALGADFDPHFHNAVVYDPAEGRRDGEVIEEFARGYMLGDRLLRPAMVKVAKA